MSHGTPSPGLESKDNSPVEIFPKESRNLLLTLDPEALSQLKQITKSLEAIQTYLAFLTGGNL